MHAINYLIAEVPVLERQRTESLGKVEQKGPDVVMEIREGFSEEEAFKLSLKEHRG